MGAKKKKVELESGAFESGKEIDRTVAQDLRKKVAAINKGLSETITGLPVFGVNEDGEQDFTIKLYSTGILALDKALNGGLPCGRITELFGEEQSGKSLIAMVAAGALQKRGGRVLLFDAEQAYEPSWAAKLGIDTANILVSDNNIVEDIMEISKKYAEAKLVDLIIIDSLGALMSRDIATSDIGAPKYGGIALPLSRCIPPIISTLKRNNVNMILVNQVRDVVGAYVPMLKTPAGRAIKHAYHTRIQVFKAKKADFVRVGEVETGVEIGTQVMKHRGGPNHTTANFRIDYRLGLDRIYDVIQLLMSENVITRAGAFYTYGDQKYQGMDALLQAFQEDGVAYTQARKFAEDLLNKEVSCNVATDILTHSEALPEKSVEE